MSDKAQNHYIFDGEFDKIFSKPEVFAFLADNSEFSPH